MLVVVLDPVLVFDLSLKSWRAIFAVCGSLVAMSSHNFIDTWNEAALEQALSEGDVNVRDRHGATPLWHAVYFGQVEWVKRLLDAGADVDGHDPLTIARSYGDGFVATPWHGLPDTAFPNPVGRGSMMHVAAARAGSVELGKCLLEHGVGVDTPDHFGCTPLHVAAFAGKIDFIDFLLEHGADPNAIDRAGFTPLDHGWSELPVVERLLARHADPNGRPHIPWSGKSYEWSSLTNAAAGGRVDVLRLLLSAKPDLSRHREALPLAAKHGHADCVKALLQAKAPVDGTTNWRGKDRTPLCSAAMYASGAAARALLARCRHELDEALVTAIEFSAEDLPEPPNDRGPARRELIGWLIEQGADPNRALGTAASAKDPSYASILLERGAQSGATDEQGEAALIHAARTGHYQVARDLLKHGADPNARSASGKSAYEVAYEAYHKNGVHDARLVMSDLVGAGAEKPGSKKPPVDEPPKEVETGLVAGDHVTHPKFGEGVVVSKDKDKVTVKFSRGGNKVLLERFLTKV